MRATCIALHCSWIGIKRRNSTQMQMKMGTKCYECEKTHLHCKSSQNFDRINWNPPKLIISKFYQSFNIWIEWIGLIEWSRVLIYFDWHSVGFIDFFCFVGKCISSNWFIDGWIRAHRKAKSSKYFLFMNVNRSRYNWLKCLSISLFSEWLHIVCMPQRCNRHGIMKTICVHIYYSAQLMINEWSQTNKSVEMRMIDIGPNLCTYEKYSPKVNIIWLKWVVVDT